MSGCLPTPRVGGGRYADKIAEDALKLAKKAADDSIEAREDLIEVQKNYNRAVELLAGLHDEYHQLASSVDGVMVWLIVRAEMLGDTTAQEVALKLNEVLGESLKRFGKIGEKDDESEAPE